MHEFIDAAHAAKHGQAMARPWLLMTTSLTHVYLMTTHGAGMIDIINSKQYASRGYLYSAVHTCVAAIHSYAVHDGVAAIHSYAVHDGLDVASYAWLHIA